MRLLKAFFLTILLTLSLFGAQWTKLQTATASSAVTMRLDSNTRVANTVLSNSNLTLTWSGGLAYSDATVNSGKFYAEITTATFSNGGIAISTETSVTATPWSFTTCWVLHDGGNYMTGSVATPNSVPKSLANRTIGILYNTTTGVLSFTVDGINYGTAYTLPVSTPVYLAVGGNGSGSATVNFGATPFVYPIPSGYKAWGAQ